MNTLNYYSQKQCIKIFNAIEQPNFRIFKTIDEDNKCRQNKGKITSPQKLYDFIHLCKNPQAIYVSVSAFLNPQSNHGNFANQKLIVEGRYFYPRKGYLIADCLLLNSYFFIDLDSEGDLRIAQQEGRKIIRALKKEKDIKLYKIQFSGRKGIHLIYKQRVNAEADPIKRIKLYHQIKAERLAKLKKLNLSLINKLHESIILNIFGVYAAPYSIKGNGGIVTPITEKQFMSKDIYSTLSITPSLGISSSPGSRKAMTSKVAYAKGDLSIPTVLKQERAGLISCFFFMDILSNGLKNNYITVLKHHKARFRTELIKRLQKTYLLSSFKIYSIGDYIYSVNTKLLQFHRLIKILRAAKSENIGFIRSRKHYPIHISQEFAEDGTTVNPMERMPSILSDFGQDDFHSFGHNKLFGFDYKYLAGKKNNINIMRMQGAEGELI